MACSVLNAAVHDPAAQLSIVPYNVGNDFIQAPHDPFARHGATTVPNGGPLHLPSTFVNAVGPRGLLHRMAATPQDVAPVRLPLHAACANFLNPGAGLTLSVRLPLHAACANFLNPGAGLMMREVLNAFHSGAAVTDLDGNLPLHIAVLNESWSCKNMNMVKRLLVAYPKGARVKNKDGMLPLHLLLLHNYGDDAADVCEILLSAYPGKHYSHYVYRVLAARSAPKDGMLLLRLFLMQNYRGRHASKVSAGLDHDPLALPAYLAISSLSSSSPRILDMLLDAVPEVLMYRDTAGAMLLHRFCWMKHPDPTETRNELDKMEGRMDHGRRHNLYSPDAELEAVVRAAKKHNLYSPVATLEAAMRQEAKLEAVVRAEKTYSPHSTTATATLEAVVRAAKKYFPHCLHHRDRHGAIPMHYLVQNVSPTSRALLKLLMAVPMLYLVQKVYLTSRALLKLLMAVTL
ncbi:hypothetical protein T484DRAFT_1817597 [Baffinella frigidus]|nr:hypothetical protein T484DRAFT_1817597 [Cryptophyta sp. CCMP2293]